MDDLGSPATVCPIAGDDALVGRLRELHLARWPAELHRFAPFSLEGESIGTGHIAVAWEPSSNVLYAQKIALGGTPPSCRLPKPIRVDDDWIARVRPVAGVGRPDYMKLPISIVPASTLLGLGRKKMLIHALIMVDPLSKGSEEDYLVNDLILFDSSLRNSRIEEMREILKEGPGFRPYVLKLLTRFIWYGGDQKALLMRTPDRGGPGKERLEPARKPGPLSLREKLAKAKAEAEGKTYVRCARRFGRKDLKNLTEGLTAYWADEKLSLESTRILINGQHYAGRPASERLTYRKVQCRYKKIVQQHKLLEKKHGPHSTRQNLSPRPGTSSELTQGVIEILDIDGFRPKAVVGGLVDGELVPINVWIIFAVSRLSGAVRGYEICLEGEQGEGYLRCIISALLPLDEHVASLGLEPLPGILTGNFDGVFVDNGAGKSAKVIEPVTWSLGGIMFYPPGGRPDLKAVVERFNGILIQIMSERTEQGYTRAHNLLDEVKRKERLRARPLTIRELERLILETIDEFNRTTDRSKLRSAEMREAGCGISPAAIHEYHQNIRMEAGDRIRPASEVYDIFLPWKPATCENGLITYKQARYKSDALIALSQAHAMIPGKKDALVVEVKRTSRRSSTLLCRGPDRTVFDIEMIDDDKKRFPNLTWKEMEVACLDDAILREGLEAQRIKDGAKRKKSNKLKVAQQDIIDEIERANGNIYAKVIGSTKTEARQNGADARDAELEANQRAAYGLPPDSSPPAETIPIQWETVEDDDPLAEAARSIEEKYRNSR